MPSVIERAYRASHRWLALGHERIAVPGAELSRDRETPRVHDANFAAAVRVESRLEIEALLEAIDAAFDASGHRHVLCDPATPAPFEARLALDGWLVRNDVLTLILEGELRARGPALSIRPVETEADWQTIDDLHWLDHQEEAAMGFHPAWARDLTRELVASKRRKAPDVRYFLARVDGIDCGFFSAWPGDDGLGVVEDLFTLAEMRGRGVGTALIAACVDDARARGAGSVLVSAHTFDTPKQMYAALGFRPLCVQRSYLKELAPR